MTAYLTGDCNGNLDWLPRVQWTGADETGHPASRAEAATVYASAGVPIFALDGKRPATTRGFHDAAPDASAWQTRPDLNIGWPLPAGYFALDVDPRHGGDRSLAELERQHGPLPMTLRQTTGSGGSHWIFRDPPGRKVRQLAGFRPGLDTRAGGRGYLVVAPSIHPETGRPYCWLSTVAPVEAPGWLLDLVCEAAAVPRPAYVPPATPDPQTLTRRQRYARAMVAGLAAEVAGAGQGQRNVTLNRAWFKCAGYRDVLDVDETRHQLLAAALSAGLNEREALQVLR